MHAPRNLCKVLVCVLDLKKNLGKNIGKDCKLNGMGCVCWSATCCRPLSPLAQISAADFCFEHSI